MVSPENAVWDTPYITIDKSDKIVACFTLVKQFIFNKVAGFLSKVPPKKR